MLALACSEELQSPEPPGASTSLATATATTPLAFTQISAGFFHTCGLTSAGRVYCWGQNFQGQLGDGTVQSRTRPVPIASNLQFAAVSAGAEYTCGVTTGNIAYCWGVNTNGQLGDGTSTSRVKPTAVAGGRHFRLVHPGQFHTCGLTPFDEAFCWGFNSDGQLGNNTRTASLVPVRVQAGTVRFRNVFAAGRYSCGATTGFVGKCWGRNDDGQLGDGTTIRRLKPTTVAGGLTFRQVSVGLKAPTSCGLTTDDLAYCWGNNQFGDIGDGTLNYESHPVPVSGGLHFRNLSPGGGHTCGVTTGHVAYCWGDNEQTELGDGTDSDRLTPTPVTGGLSFRVVAVGFFHTCGIATDDRAYCWGNNQDGQLGNGTADQSPSPHPVPEAVVGP
jgi:alpha-tubulin suppressor-like RCC1 family protein